MQVSCGVVGQKQPSLLKVHPSGQQSVHFAGLFRKTTCSASQPTKVVKGTVLDRYHMVFETNGRETDREPRLVVGLPDGKQKEFKVLDSTFQLVDIGDTVPVKCTSKSFLGIHYTSRRLDETAIIQERRTGIPIQYDRDNSKLDPPFLFRRFQNGFDSTN